MIPEAFREGPVYRDRHSAPFQRRFPFFDLNRNMPVDDQSIRWLDSKLGENLFTKPNLVDQAEVRIFCFLLGTFVGDQTALERPAFWFR